MTIVQFPHGAPGKAVKEENARHILAVYYNAGFNLNTAMKLDRLHTGFRWRRQTHTPDDFLQGLAYAVQNLWLVHDGAGNIKLLPEGYKEMQLLNAH